MVASVVDADGVEIRRRGEFVITEHGVEGSLIYALSALLRDAIERAGGNHALVLDLLPDHDTQRVREEVERDPRGARSLSSHLQSRLGLKGVKMALLNELLSRQEMNDPVALAAAIKALPVRLVSTRPLDEAISSAGGVLFEALDENLMIREWPGVFCAGEMLDWEAPTGGYLLTACLASGFVAGRGAFAWLVVQCGDSIRVRQLLILRAVYRTPVPICRPCALAASALISFNDIPIAIVMSATRVRMRQGILSRSKPLTD